MVSWPVAWVEKVALDMLIGLTGMADLVGLVVQVTDYDLVECLISNLIGFLTGSISR